MKVYTLQLNHDGLVHEFATNGRSLYDLILKQEYGVEFITVYDHKINKFVEINFNYDNVVKAIKMSSVGGRRVHFDCESNNGNNVRIQELTQAR